MILYPDQRVNQPDNETVCFGAPIHKCDWEFLFSRGRKNTLQQTGMRYAVIIDEEVDAANAESRVYDSVYFMRNDAEINDKVCVLLRNNEDEDTCLESAAWIRITENFPGMIYIVKAGNETADKWQSMSSAIGTEQSCVCMVDFITITNEE